jgi:hypothetical protein
MKRLRQDIIVCLLFAYDIRAPKRLANCQLYTNYCSAHPYKKFPSGTLFRSKKSHRMYWDPQSLCKLCVKDEPASLMSQCVNKLGSICLLSSHTTLMCK